MKILTRPHYGVYSYSKYVKHCKNAKIYVVEEDSDEFVLGGVDHINSKKPKLDVDKYLDDETYPNMVKIHLNDIISEKLDGKELEIKHRGEIVTYKIKYKGLPCEILLDAKGD